MDILIEKAISVLFTKETAFFGLFIVSYYLLFTDKVKLQEFLIKQQDVLKDLTHSVQDIAKTQEKQHERIERMEDNLDHFYDKVNNRLENHTK